MADDGIAKRPKTALDDGVVAGMRRTIAQLESDVRRLRSEVRRPRSDNTLLREGNHVVLPVSLAPSVDLGSTRVSLPISLCSSANHAS